MSDQVLLSDMVVHSNTAQINALHLHGQAYEVPQTHIYMKKFSLRGDKDYFFQQLVLIGLRMQLLCTYSSQTELNKPSVSFPFSPRKKTSTSWNICAPLHLLGNNKKEQAA